ncbi:MULTISPECIES: hypothetical protein [Clostridium]|uniref:hypothetical protein n=1 Tax=Clostridium TaxID=1485 RepID=UPI00290BF076|nr:hypothetical protein [Clostridium sp.]MDK0798454.1 hypothetical protein [Clostridium perfringens]MDM0866186.1 hypothetical protein [Clostridium perfringens]MDU4427910.1 hypothetical protein [Clostridium sp.]MDU7456285.1 hypothetical protein [Clostridium perfringens]
MEVLQVQISVFDILQNKVIKKTKEYEIIKCGEVYRIHFYDKKDRDKCRVTKNFEYVKRYL